MKKVVGLSIVGIFLIFSTNSFAISLATNAISISTTVAARCFGSTVTQPISLDQNSEGYANFTVNCSNSTPYNIFITYGSNATLPTAAESVQQRNLSSPTNNILIPYFLFADSSRTIKWNDAAIDPSNSATKGTGGDGKVFTVYARVSTTDSSGKLFPPGDYNDNPVIRIEY